MKKKALALVMWAAVSFNVYSDMPVIDITNIIAAIENGYTLYQQLEAMYNNLRASYDQLQQQIENFQAFDINSLDLRDPLGSWRSIMTYADRMMTYEENIERVINNKNIKIGKQSWSLGDIFTTNPSETFRDMAASGAEFVAVDPFETLLTTEEKAAFNQKYGMSYGHYMRYAYLGDAVKKKAAEITAYSSGLQENLQEDREMIDKVVQDGSDIKSVVEGQQAANVLAANQAQELKTQSKLLSGIAEMMANKSAVEEMEKEDKRAQINNFDFDASEGFLNQLKDSPGKSEFERRR